MTRIAQVPSFLTWMSNSTFPEAMAGEHKALLARTFESWLTCHGGEAAGQLCRKYYSSLPSNGQIRFLRIAATGVGLQQDESGGDFFGQHLLSELRRTQPSVPVGDECAGVGVVSLSERAAREILIDTGGIYRPPGPTHWSTYNDEEARYAVSRLRQSLKIAWAVNSAAAKMIETVTQLIILRQDAADPSGFSSSSWPGCVGLMALTNVQRPNLENAWLVDALIHESVHSLLYMIECFEPFYATDMTPLAHQAVSPWSGKELNLHSYVHACFVWFALWCFWSLTATSKFFPKATVEFFCARARRGFGADLLSRLGPGREEIGLSIQDAVATMEAIVSRS